MVNVRANMGDMEMTCEGDQPELIADICCIIKAIGEGVPEQYREVFYESLLQTLEEVCIEEAYGN